MSKEHQSQQIEPARPMWPHKEITEKDFRSIMKAMPIEQVKAKWEFTGVDTSREWLEVTPSNGKPAILPDSWRAVLKFVGYAHTPGLFEMNYLGEQCEKTVARIDKWERENAADRRTYERLKTKFAKVEPFK